MCVLSSPHEVLSHNNGAKACCTILLGFAYLRGADLRGSALPFPQGYPGKLGTSMRCKRLKRKNICREGAPGSQQYKQNMSLKGLLPVSMRETQDLRVHSEPRLWDFPPAWVMEARTLLASFPGIPLFPQLTPPHMGSLTLVCHS